MQPLLLAAVICALASSATQASPALERETVNQALYSAGKASKMAVLKLQVLLDRAGFSPGIIDGVEGPNFEIALKAFERKANLPPDGKIDVKAWEALSADGSEILTHYTLAEADVKGPFVDE